MFDFLQGLFDSEFMPHGHCYLWQPEILWLHVASDTIIALAYYSIPIALFYFARKRLDLTSRYRWVFVLFGAFILLCGTTHLLEIWSVWKGTYRLTGLVKAATGLVSIGAAAFLWPVIPEALKLRSPTELEAINEQLSRKIVEHQQAEARLRLYKDLVEHIPIGLNVYHLEDRQDLKSFRLLIANSAASEASDLDIAPFVGKTLFESFPAVYDAGLPDIYADVIRTAEARELGEVIYGDDKITERIYSVKAFPLHGLYMGLSLENVTERKQREEALLESERRFRSSFDYASIGKAHVGIDGRWLEVNSSLCKLLGYTKEELLAIDFQTITHPEDLQEDLNYVQQMLAGKRETYQMEKRYFHKEGHIIWAILSVSLVQDMQEQPLYFIAQIQDVTARKQAEERIHALNTELEERVAERTAQLETANKELNDFAYVASHDLQAPLHTMSNFAQLLQRRYRGQLDDKADEFIEAILEGAERSQTQIRDLLSFSRVGRQELDLQRVDTAKLLTQTLSGLQAVMHETKAIVTHDPLPTLKADPTLLRLVLQNLITNGIKFHGTAPPRVHVSATRLKDAWRFSIKDHGIGVAPEYHDRIFVIFKRLQSRSEYPGTGIGLALCKKIVERHGGQLWLTSEPGQGSTFFFTIPIQRAPANV